MDTFRPCTCLCRDAGRKRRAHPTPRRPIEEEAARASEPAAMATDSTSFAPRGEDTREHADGTAEETEDEDEGEGEGEEEEDSA